MPGRRIWRAGTGHVKLADMPVYRAVAVISLESSDRNDRLHFRTTWGARIDADVHCQALRCQITSDGGQRLLAIFAEVAVNSQGEAYGLVCAALNVIVPIVSLEIQRGHVNRHYGTIRATWSRAGVDVTPADDWPTAEVAMQSVQRVDMSAADGHLAAVARTPELAVLVANYDRALAPDDDETRFFNAFAIIEFIETRFATRARFQPLLPNEIAGAIVGAARARARDLLLDPQIVDRVGNAVADPLRRATAMGRAAKLLAVLREVFGLTTLTEALGPFDVNEDLVRQMIRTRNRLFHGAAADHEVGRLADKLTLLVEAILHALLEGRVAVPAPEPADAG